MIEINHMLTVHHLNNSRSHRIIWLLEELSVQYEIKYYQRDPKTMLAPPAYKELHPLGTAPIISDDDLTITESGAVMEYLLYKYGQNRLKPLPGTPEWINYNFWMHFAEGSLMPILFLRLVIDIIYQKSPFFVKPITKSIKSRTNHMMINPRLTKQMNFIESTLEKNAWLAGNEFSAADIQMAIPLLWASSIKDLYKNKPKITNYIERLKSRPAFTRTIEKGGPIDRVAILSNNQSRH